MASVHYDVDYCLASVRPEHAAFYRRVFLAKQLGGEQYYPGLQFPVCMYAAEVPTIRDTVYKRYPFFMSTEDERQKMFGSESFAVKSIQPTARLAQRLAELVVA
jgi:hypothetical protein